jgi:hypothetical protein
VTTEVAIMNRAAVALAADSAVTIATEQGVKVYDSVNKLFELIKGRPVGVMIYNAVDVALRPWETVIKTYREDRRHVHFGSLDEYAEDFLAYMSSQRHLFSEQQQEDALLFAAIVDAQKVRREVDVAVRILFAQKKQPTEFQIRRLVKARVEDFTKEVEAWSQGPWAANLPSERSLMLKQKGMLDRVVQLVFQQLPMSRATSDGLRRALMRSFVRYHEDDDAFSGVVIAGFGHDEYYPSLREFKVKGMLENSLMTIREDPADISVWEPAYVESFAQGDMVRSFTVGIQDKVRGQMMRFWEEWVANVSGTATKMSRAAVNTLTRQDAKVIGSTFGQLATDGVDNFLRHMQNYEDEIKGELLQSLAHLPKDEMGLMAESLVNLTTLKRRVSINDAQTVGGAVDVAVVSKGDGFVWLKRKHYFSQALNPNWAALHAGTAP